MHTRWTAASLTQLPGSWRCEAAEALRQHQASPANLRNRSAPLLWRCCHLKATVM